MVDDLMWGCRVFLELCNELIDTESDYLYPMICRTRSEDWVATIYNHHDKDRRYPIAQGQGLTMDDACQLAVDDYRERQRVKARKAELLKISEVVEALELFGVKVEGEK